MNTPPLGIMPKKLHDEIRFKELGSAIYRMLAAYEEVPVEWIEEYNDLVKQYRFSSSS